MAVPLPPPVTPPPTVRQLADDILSRREFRREPPSLIDRVTDWLQDRFNEVVGAVAGTDGSLVGWLVVLGLLGLVAFALWRAVRAFQREPGPTGIAVDGIRRSAVDWRADAAGHEAAGRWREALRCHWRALVADLAGRGLVEEVPGRTTGEYRRAVGRAAPAVAAPFADATALFEVAWYAAAEVSADDNGRCKALAQQVLTGVGR